MKESQRKDAEIWRYGKKREAWTTMKGYSEWTSRSHLIAELRWRQHKRQPERGSDREERRGGIRTKPPASSDDVNTAMHTNTHVK